MRILIACEESQRVCKAFREKGHEAYSCDIQECSGGHPEWHIMGDCLPLLNGNCEFSTMDGETHKVVGKWDLIIAHPPCTFLSNVATRHFSMKCCPPEKVIARWEERAKAAVFFMRFALADCDHIAVENPVGFMNSAYRKPDQIIQPYYFAESVDDIDNYATKRTGLWLKGLPELTYDCTLPNPMDNAPTWSNGKKKNWTENTHEQKARSKTFPGVAKAMAEQWGKSCSRSREDKKGEAQ